MMHNNGAKGAAEVYRTQQVMTATPAELTLMLYNGAIKFTNEALKALAESKYEQANASAIKAQKIITEFMATLDMKWEFSAQWLAVYEYIYWCLTEGNLQADAAKLEEAKVLIVEFRDTWRQAMKAAQEEKVGGASQLGELA